MIAPQKEGGTKKMDINKKVLASVFIISMLAFSLGYGTYSYFSDTETSSGNKFTAGTLNLKVDGQDDGGTVPVYFAVDNVKPGDGGSQVISLSNTGTLNGTAKIHIKNVVNTEGLNPEPETDKEDPGDLGAVLLIKIQYDANNDGDYLDEGETIVTDVAINTLNCTLNTLGSLGAGTSRNLKISWSVPGTVGNDIMGDIVTFDIEFSLVQP
jgi:predicted ribosomally synthesized peptide with SipW-like signal peptide